MRVCQPSTASVLAAKALTLYPSKMSIVAEQPLETLGLAGDGDEISVITDVERVFGVKLDYTNASTWLTVGDVFKALRSALPDRQSSDSVWAKFADVVASETGVDPSQITESTLLLGEKRFGWRLWAIGLGIGGVAVLIRFVG